MTSAIVALEIFASFVCLILLYANRFETNERTKKRNVFQWVLWATFFAQFSDLVSWLLEGSIRYAWLSYHLVVVSLIGTYIISLLFVEYVYAYLSEKNTISIKYYRLIQLVCIFFIIITLIGCLTHQVFEIKNGYFQTKPLYWVYYLSNAISLLFVLGIIVYYHKVFGKKKFLSILSYTLMPIFEMILNWFIPELSVAYPVFTLSLLLIFIIIQSDHETVLILHGQEVTRQANQDELTGLWNRRVYIQMLEYYQQQEGTIGVLFGDINGLKYTNDHQGHQKGDDLIVKFTEILETYFRKDEIFRISGDEFIVLLPMITEEMLERRVQSVEDALQKYIFPLACIGTAHGDMRKIEALIRIAEDKMYESKKNFYKEYPNFKR